MHTTAKSDWEITLYRQILSELNAAWADWMANAPEGA
jgi:hypothetical protein